MSDIKAETPKLKQPNPAVLAKYKNYVSELISHGQSSNLHWNIVKINGAIIPGFVEIQGSNNKDLVTFKTTGISAEIVKDMGRKAASITLSIQMDGRDWTVFNDLIIPLLDLDSQTRQQNVLLLENQLLVQQKLQYVMLDSWNFQTPKSGLIQYQLSFKQWTYAPKVKIPEIIVPVSLADATAPGANDLTAPGAENGRASYK